MMLCYRIKMEFETLLYTISILCTLEGFYVSMYQSIKNTLILSTVGLSIFFPNT